MSQRVSTFHFLSLIIRRNRVAIQVLRIFLLVRFVVYSFLVTCSVLLVNADLASPRRGSCKSEVVWCSRIKLKAVAVRAAGTRLYYKPMCCSRIRCFVYDDRFFIQSLAWPNYASSAYRTWNYFLAVICSVSGCSIRINR